MATRKRRLTDTDKRVAARVRDLWKEYQRANQGTSQEIAAARAGMTQSAFSQFLLGRVPIRMSPALKLARLFGVPPTAIRDDLPEIAYARAPRVSAVEAREPAPGELTAEAIETARAFMRLEPQSRQLFRWLMFVHSVVDRSYPWLRIGRPISENYEKFEKAHVDNMQAQLALEAARIAKK